MWRFLSAHACWGWQRSKADVRESVRGAWRVVGCYQTCSEEMVGFARAVSDAVGLGKRLVETMISAGPAAGFRWLLHKTDAHGLSAQCGFRPRRHAARAATRLGQIGPARAVAEPPRATKSPLRYRPVPG